MELTIEQVLQQGVAAHKEGKLQDAERLYRAILQSQPTHPDANHNLGLIAVSVNKAEAALPLFKTALEANPKVEQFWLSYIDALIKEQQFENARQALEQAKKRGLGGERLISLEAQLSPKTQIENVNSASPSQQQLNSLLEYYQNGRFSEAEKLGVEITQEFPKHPFAWKVLGAVLRATGRKSEAVDSNQTAVALSPQDAQAHSNLGIILQELGRLEEAEASYTQAIALQPDYAEGHYNLGNTLKELGRLYEAEASYNQAIALKPDLAEAHSNLGTTLLELGRLDEAEASCAQAIALKPDFAEAHINLGITLQNLNRWDEAEVSYSQAIFLKPDYDDALIKRGQLLLKRNEFERALRDFEFCNNHRDSILYALIALYALGRIDEMYVKFKTHFVMDDVNIGLEAFSSFIYEKEKRDTGHYFCRNPMDFLYFSNLATHIEDPTSFTEGLIEDLRKKPVNWNPSSTSTNNGFQGKHNLFHNPRGKVRNLHSIIMHELVLYYQKFKNESCSYIQKWPSQKHLAGWHIILKQHGYQTPHIHTGGWLSGVIYLKLVPPLGKDEGAIEFSLNGENYTDSNSPKLVYQPELGDIVFFPSSLHHRTIPFTTDTDRIIVSFDLMPKVAKS